MKEQYTKRMVDMAQSIEKDAYCPYSKFPVGAVVLAEDDTIHCGCNVENASYGLTICAERSAIFRMVSSGKTKIKKVVIYTPTPTPSAPCGACRQVINEFGLPDTEILSICDGPDVLRCKLSDLLPNAFGPHNLKG